jgi:putative transposase
MSASARGTKEAPGSNVSANSGLNKSILDQGWFEQVDARHTSQRCSCCGHTEKGNRKSQIEFVCLSCSIEQHADVIAAKNILTVGLTGIACGSNRKGGRKQEPAGILTGIAQANSDGVLPLAS